MLNTKETLPSTKERLTSIKEMLPGKQEQALSHKNNNVATINKHSYKLKSSLYTQDKLPST